MASISDVPELVKSMNYYFGEKWGSRIGKTIVLFVLVGVVSWAVNSVFVWINTLTGISGTALTIVIIVLSVLLWIVVLFLIGITLTSILRMFGFPVRRNIESLLAQSRELLLDAMLKVDVGNAEALVGVITELDTIDKQWNESRMIKLTKWMMFRRPSKH